MYCSLNNFILIPERFVVNHQKYQSRSFSIGTSRSAERLMELLKDSDQVKTATGERAERNSSTVFSGSATVPSVISNVSAHEVCKVHIIRN